MTRPFDQDPMHDATGHPSLSGHGPLRARTSGPGQPLKLQLFETLRARGETARVDLGRALDLSPATVTALTSELLDAGLIEERSAATEAEPSKPNRGRPRVALGVRAGAGHVCGIKLSDRENSAVILDMTGQIISQASLPAPKGQRSIESILTEATTLITAAIAQAELTQADLCAVGIGVPGVVDHASGQVLWSPLMAARDVDLARALGRRLGCPVLIDNDANLLTLAELWFGAGRQNPNFAVVTIEHGVGMGLVIDHRLYRGARGLGMELGHAKVQLDGALCRCGRRGCLEAYVADYALKREASTALPRLVDHDNLIESLFAAAKSGNTTALAIFERAGRYLALGLANVVTLFDPEMIILSGERLRYDFLYGDSVLDEMRLMMLDMGREPPRVEIHAWGDFIWAQGAAAMALDAATERLVLGG